MSKIKFIKLSNYLGVTESEIEPLKINIIKGPKGAGKTSIIEGLEKGITNKSRRTEVIKHGETEASIYIEMDDGLEINRKIRKDSSNYLSLRKQEQSVPSTEKFLRSLIKGDIFRPLDFISLSIREQTKVLLAMLEIEWTEQDIINWFGCLVDNIDYSNHILIVLKDIEQKYYKIREEVNREIRELNARIKTFYEELPPEYDGEEWRDKNVQEYYKKVSDAQHVNALIDKAKSLKDNFAIKVEAIRSNGENEKYRIALKYKSMYEDTKDIIELSKSKIEKATMYIDNSNYNLDVEISKLDRQLENEYNELLQKYTVLKENKKNEILREVKDQNEIIEFNKNKISVKEQELISLSDKEELEKSNIDETVKGEIEKEEIRIGNASKYLDENEMIDINTLQSEADHVSDMVGYLREWDRIIETRDGILNKKERYASELTVSIEKARALPGELLKTANMPISGISVDSEGRVRINETLIDGLSDGEKLELAMKIAKAQCGELKVICIDKFESLDTVSQHKLISEMEKDDFQYFITEVVDTDNDEVIIEKIGEAI